jgi:hypothetical protein
MVAIDASTYTGEGRLAEALGGQVLPGISSWSGAVDPTKPLQLVWCHERCHKQESETRRRAISKAAHDSGAVLICVKKATKFAAWLADGQRQPCVLLTDWREAKPCLETAALQPPTNRPVATVVLCEQGQQFKRASAWTQTVSRDLGLVHVCQDAGSQNTILTELLACLLRAAAASAGLSVGEKAPGGVPGPVPAVPGQRPAVPTPVSTKPPSAKNRQTLTQSDAWNTPFSVYDQPPAPSANWATTARTEDVKEEHISRATSQLKVESRWVPGAVLKQEASLNAPTYAGGAMALTPSMVQVLSSIYAANTGLQKEQLRGLWETAALGL